MWTEPGNRFGPDPQARRPAIDAGRKAGPIRAVRRGARDAAIRVVSAAVPARRRIQAPAPAVRMVRTVPLTPGGSVSEAETVLTICTTCRMGTTKREGVAVPGQMLHDRLTALLAQADGSALRLHKVECLAVCNDGCAAAIAEPGKWSYLLGRLTPDKAADLLQFAGSYRQSRTGTVMPSKRAASLADMILGRIPTSVPTLAGEAAA